MNQLEKLKSLKSSSPPKMRKESNNLGLEDTPKIQNQLSSLYSPIMQQKQSATNSLPIIIGVCGGHSSGKIYFCEMLRWYLNKQNINAQVVKQEAYETRVGELKKTTVVDWQALNECIREMSDRFDTVIIEGTLVFENKDILNTMMIKIFLDTDDDTRLSRYIYKDVCIKGKSISDSVENYLRDLRPLYEERVLPTKHNADIIIPNYGDGYSEHLKISSQIDIKTQKTISGFATIDDPVFGLLTKTIVDIVESRQPKRLKEL